MSAPAPTLAAVALTCEGEFTDIELTAGDTLPGLYQAIGCGLVDVVALTAQLDMWVDEEGMITSGPNPLATRTTTGSRCSPAASTTRAT